ncbi:trypsin-like peptidase domain-containing protein [Aurantibacter sp.]|uniref:trypsin-like peptidase domain-containing protein n=1 Tax=Aurantibacter sp. TaxID=2807103 RepID=UPI0035C84A9C
MKKLMTLVLVSVLGGIITLGSYKLLFEKEEKKSLVKATSVNPIFSNVDYNSTKLTTLEKTDFSIAAEKTIHTVVHVKNVTTNNGSPTLEDLFFGRMQKRQQLGTGSGVIISPDGYIITNNHVIDGSQALTVTLNDNRTFNAEIIGTDPKTDIALLKIETIEELPYTTFADSDMAKIGEWVLAVGNPFNLTSTVTAGIISAKSRDLSSNNSQSFIQTDAAVNPGNSGGALVNTNGDLIGINTAISSQTGSYIGYSFAVPSNIAKKVVQDIMEFGNVQNGILGVTGGALNGENLEQFGESQGFYISEIEEGSGAEKAGLQSGDIIKKIDQTEINKFSDLSGYLATKRPNDVVKVEFIRNGAIETSAVTLLKNNSYIINGIAKVKNATEKDLKAYKLDYGVKITKLNDTNALHLKRYGVNEGQVITKLNDKVVKSVDDIKAIIDAKPNSEPLRFEVVNKSGETERFYFK